MLLLLLLLLLLYLPWLPLFDLFLFGLLLLLLLMVLLFKKTLWKKMEVGKTFSFEYTAVWGAPGSWIPKIKISSF